MVPRSGRLIATGDRYEPYQLIGPDRTVVEAAAGFFWDLLAAGRADPRSARMAWICCAGFASLMPSG